MTLSYENYMNLLYHIDHSGESVTVNSEVAKKIVSNAVSPVVAVTSTSLLDSHLQEAYGCLLYTSRCV